MHALLAVTFWQFLSHDLLHPLTGPGSAGQGGYLFWSGIAGSFILGGGIWVGSATLLRKHNCHVRGCPFIGRHPVAGGTYVVCPLHHRKITGIEKVTTDHVRDRHREHEIQRSRVHVRVGNRVGM